MAGSLSMKRCLVCPGEQPKVLLDGSTLKGTALKDSDVDLVVRTQCVLPRSTIRKLHRVIEAFLAEQYGNRNVKLKEKRKSAEFVVRVLRTATATAAAASSQEAEALQQREVGAAAAGGPAGAPSGPERREQGEWEELSADLLFESATLGRPVSVSDSGSCPLERSPPGRTAVMMMKIFQRKAGSLPPLKGYVIEALVRHVVSDCCGNVSGGHEIAPKPSPSPAMSAAQAFYMTLSLFLVEPDARSLDGRVCHQLAVPSGSLFDRGELHCWRLRADRAMRFLSDEKEVAGCDAVEHFRRVIEFKTKNDDNDEDNDEDDDEEEEGEEEGEEAQQVAANAVGTKSLSELLTELARGVTLQTIGSRSQDPWNVVRNQDPSEIRNSDTGGGGGGGGGGGDCSGTAPRWCCRWGAAAEAVAVDMEAAAAAAAVTRAMTEAGAVAVEAPAVAETDLAAAAPDSSVAQIDAAPTGYPAPSAAAAAATTSVGEPGGGDAALDAALDGRVLATSTAVTLPPTPAPAPAPAVAAAAGLAKSSAEELTAARAVPPGGIIAASVPGELANTTPLFGSGTIVSTFGAPVPAARGLSSRSHNSVWCPVERASSGTSGRPQISAFGTGSETVDRASEPVAASQAMERPTAIGNAAAFAVPLAVRLAAAAQSRRLDDPADEEPAGVVHAEAAEAEAAEAEAAEAEAGRRRALSAVRYLPPPGPLAMAAAPVQAAAAGEWLNGMGVLTSPASEAVAVLPLQAVTTTTTTTVPTAAVQPPASTPSIRTATAEVTAAPPETATPSSFGAVAVPGESGLPLPAATSPEDTPSFTSPYSPADPVVGPAEISGAADAAPASPTSSYSVWDTGLNFELGSPTAAAAAATAPCSAAAAMTTTTGTEALQWESAAVVTTSLSSPPQSPPLASGISSYRGSASTVITEGIASQQVRGGGGGGGGSGGRPIDIDHPLALLFAHPLSAAERARCFTYGKPSAGRHVPAAAPAGAAASAAAAALNLPSTLSLEAVGFADVPSASSRGEKAPCNTALPQPYGPTQLPHGPTAAAAAAAEMHHHYTSLTRPPPPLQTFAGPSYPPLQARSRLSHHLPSSSHSSSHSSSSHSSSHSPSPPSALEAKPDVDAADPIPDPDPGLELDRDSSVGSDADPDPGASGLETALGIMSLSQSAPLQPPQPRPLPGARVAAEPTAPPASRFSSTASVAHGEARAAARWPDGSGTGTGTGSQTPQAATAEAVAVAVQPLAAGNVNTTAVRHRKANSGNGFDIGRAVDATTGADADATTGAARSGRQSAFPSVGRPGSNSNGRLDHSRLVWLTGQMPMGLTRSRTEPESSPRQAGGSRSCGGGGASGSNAVMPPSTPEAPSHGKPARVVTIPDPNASAAEGGDESDTAAIVATAAAGPAVARLAAPAAALGGSGTTDSPARVEIAAAAQNGAVARAHRGLDGGRGENGGGGDGRGDGCDGVGNGGEADGSTDVSCQATCVPADVLKQAVPPAGPPPQEPLPMPTPRHDIFSPEVQEVIATLRAEFEQRYRAATLHLIVASSEV
ncbi:hypothetical protein VOLCADRAFT_107096 [Volvox carteri f. nagariensis]|uniref:Polymerase nucleotidyl transferase domain-containing protein n=1 Tax=Volvox carteri f. nagariensis TaxID=3068 RepID=D8UBX2_VOLCA|nr:uncharacterized protein VOLCADRAFT_107096 [Volvox carteri f. nagariensis]EFJ42746.1 hypothetical protein VOLCADRAFT_107096 [Volvox carteri f. nagariensis]|eukprot:XP_002956207.1 hypothetical protein VOLCADRAFT_107096 [Volvox carteri f. nagariensis]